MKIKIRTLLKNLTVAFIVLSLGFAVWFLVQESPKDIQEFDDARDMKQVLAIFGRDRYWLLGDAESSPDFILRYRSPSDTRYLGKLKIKVLWEKNAFVGFVAYYMKNQTLGQLLFLDINPEFRGKGFSEKLVQHALQELKKLGAEEICMWTRVDNARARALYKRIGFAEQFEDDGFIFLTIPV